MVWLVLLFPVIGVLLNGFLGPRLGKGFVKWVGPLVVLAAFVVSVWTFLQLDGRPADQRVLSPDPFLWQWITSGSFQVPVALRIDPLSVTMMLVITGVGFLIHVYSTGYMAEDRLFARFFTYLNLFTFAMLLLVMANNYLLMFVGWEGVGLCSYLLIGFFFEKESAASAGKKAFLVNRVGDWGFLLGLMLLFWTFGTLDYTKLFAAISQAGPANRDILTAIALLLFLGATGKSAQLPLYLWLPDAMEGPTPVSALIHAATMVTAGVYMIARSHVLFEASPLALNVVAWVGVITALFAATIAMVQNDIKRVLAYSTVSQLGYMFVGVGVGAYAAGIFHLVTHAFFKALLFLAAGSVMHALAGELDMRRMGGLRKYLPWTFGTMLVAWLAISGIPPFAGFYSKDVILEAAYDKQFWIWLIGLVTAGLTAFYMSRMFFTIFFGPEHYVPPAHDHAHGHEHDHGHGHGGIHESPPSMAVPLIVLGVLSLIGGFWLSGHPLPQPGGTLADFLTPAVGLPSPGRGGAGGEVAQGGLGPTVLMLFSIGAAVLGIAIAWGMHTSGAFLRERRTAIRTLLENRYGYDALLHSVVVVGGTELAVALWKYVDVGIIDGLVNGVGSAVAGAAQALRQWQTGYVRNYALTMLIGAVAVLVLFSFFFIGH
jgi:NADH-quinone oxidoreductase subunit L